MNDGSYDQVLIHTQEQQKGVTGSHIQKIVIQPDNKIIIGGFFSRFNAVSRNNIARLTSSGTLDATFNPGTGFAPVFVAGTNYSTEPIGMIRDMILENAGPNNLKLYVSGSFTLFNNSTQQRVIRLNCTTNAGSKDTGFSMGGNGNSTYGPNNHVWTMYKQTDEKIILGGEFTEFKNYINQVTSALRITRIFPANTLTGELKGINPDYFDIETEGENDIFAIDNHVLVYPNPTNGDLFIENLVDFDKNFTIELFSVLGQKVFSEKYDNSNSKKVDVSDLTSGTYFLKISDNVKSIQKTIIIK